MTRYPKAAGNRRCQGWRALVRRAAEALGWRRASAAAPSAAPPSVSSSAVSSSVVPPATVPPASAAAVPGAAPAVEVPTQPLPADLVDLVSHELRTPLTAIVGGLEVVLDGSTGPLNPAQQRLLGTVDRNAKRLQGTVSDLLDLGAIAPSPETGTLRHEPLVLQAVAGHAVRVVTVRNPEAGAAVRVVAPAEPVLLSGDTPRLVRMLTTVLTGALRLTPPGGAVELAVGVAGGAPFVRVAGAQGGVPEDEYTGMGLGLPVARRIALQHGGTLTVERVGGGAAVRVQLPARPG